jgi:hypothetical protein
VADKSSQLVLNALSRAAALAGAVPLHGNKSCPGLFPATALGKQAAQRCRDEGYLRLVESAEAPRPQGVVRDGEAAVDSGRSRRPAPSLCAITDKGLSYLLTQVSPRQVLEDFVRVLEAREGQVAGLLTLARQMQGSLEALRANVGQVLRAVPDSLRTLPAADGAGGDLKALFRDFLTDRPPDNGAAAPDSLRSPSTVPPPEPDVCAALLAQLERWAASGPAEDCPLPELFRRLQEADSLRAQAALPSIGAFHDALRWLHAGGQVYLHPWTGPLYDIPEPPYALLVGHEVAYYASLRQ